MSLVDASYGSDDDDDVVDEEKVELPATTGIVVSSSDVARNDTVISTPSVSSSVSTTIVGQSGRRVILARNVRSPTRAVPAIRLPDVSDLLGPSASDPVPMSDTQKKRPASNGSAHALLRAKIPRGNLHPARVSPDTAGGLLTPPQLRGRSNVATEDLDKIFSRKQRR